MQGGRGEEATKEVDETVALTSKRILAQSLYIHDHNLLGRFQCTIIPSYPSIAGLVQLVLLFITTNQLLMGRPVSVTPTRYEPTLSDLLCAPFPCLENHVTKNGYIIASI